MPRGGLAGLLRNNLRLPDSLPERRKSSNALLSLWRRRPYSLAATLFIAVYTILALHLRYMTAEKTWITPFNILGPPTLVYDVRDMRRVWEWEIAAGHYPSSHRVPFYMGSEILENPARPFQSEDLASTTGVGGSRTYVSPKVTLPNASYPPRPIPGSSADLDIVMHHCDFSAGKYVRDCLKLLRNGAELDAVSHRVRGGSSEHFSYIYVTGAAEGAGHPRVGANETNQVHNPENYVQQHTGKRRGRPGSHLTLPPLPTATAQNSPHSPCHGTDRRIFHMFWTGEFTDKPYMAFLSFLYTQNLGLHLPPEHPPPTCRTELWFWITQPEWARHKRATWERRMFDELKVNPWASMFLHLRFKEVIHFKVWDAVEQLDATAELKDEWRRYRHMVFKSKSPRDQIVADDPADDTDDAPSDPLDNSTALTARSPAGADTYDKPSVALSDLVRFVLCYRFGGVYLDVDTLFLRDWEELWGAPGAFAYRWSRMDRYNTAVLRMHRQSALGTWILRTALKNGLDFHPIRVTQYLKDAEVEGLLRRLPDALFDPAWLMVEGFHPERPPQPLLNTFDDFFMTPPLLAASPEALGFDGLYKGSYSYHYHNKWWIPFDPDRNYPDLGSRFVRDQSLAEGHLPEVMHDLSWSAVMKRTFEAYIRGEQPNMYGEWLHW